MYNVKTQKFAFSKKKKNEIMEKIDLIIEVLEKFSDEELLNLLREIEYFDYSRCRDWYINDECFFEDNFSSFNDVARAVCFGEYYYNDEFVQFDGYGNLVSSNKLDIDLEDVADYILYKNCSCDNDEIESILADDDLDGIYKGRRYNRSRGKMRNRRY